MTDISPRPNATAEALPLSRVPAELRRQFGDAPSYRKLAERVRDGEITEVECSNGRYYLPPGKVSAVAARFGLTAPQQTAA